VRHPIYTATLVYAAALAIITANYVLAAAIFGPMALLVTQRLGCEEQMMIDEFGDEYRVYMQSTGRLLPKWRRS
jgi:protein-S-isoprenylcysteine O-methyltransferase Ste14